MSKGRSAPRTMSESPPRQAPFRPWRRGRRFTPSGRCVPLWGHRFAVVAAHEKGAVGFRGRSFPNARAMVSSRPKRHLSVGESTPSKIFGHARIGYGNLPQRGLDVCQMIGRAMRACVCVAAQLAFHLRSLQSMATSRWAQNDGNLLFENAYARAVEGAYRSMSLPRHRQSDGP